jgi:hypothetical protein
MPSTIDAVAVPDVGGTRATITGGTGAGANP